MRQCPFADCGRSIRDEMFACGRHWHALNPWQQARIWTAYREYLAVKIGPEELRCIQDEVLSEVQAGRGK
jgi:hypothetical protein